MGGWPASSRLASSLWVVLLRAFLTQFFASESVNEETHRRQTVAWVLAFLVVPGLFLVVRMLPAYRLTLLRAQTFGMPELVDQLLIAIGSVFVVFSMVTTGFIAAFTWEALAFDRRDAMVLGPLPVRAATVISAKIAALGLFFLGASSVVNLISAAPFALIAADRRGGSGVLGGLTAHLSATIGSGLFVFSVVVLARAVVGLAGHQIAAAVGSVVQFAFVSLLLCVVFLVPAVSPARFQLIDAADMRWVPPAWYVGLYERELRLVSPHFEPLAEAALPATIVAALLAVAVCVASYRRQLRLALVPAGFAGVMGHASVSRWIARRLVRTGAGASIADFVLLTLARNGATRGPLAMNAAVGVAVVAAAFSRHGLDVTALTRPRTLVLWVPLVLTYWVVIGLRAAFFLPSELPASWTFPANGGEPSVAFWSGTRAAMLAFVLPRMLCVTALLTPLVGWRVAAWHALLASALLALLIQIVMLTVAHVPFTREYRVGHARLRSLWPLYLIGLFAFAYWPVQLELRLLDSARAMVILVACIGVAAGALEALGRSRARRWSLQAPDDDEDAAIVLFGSAGSGAPSVSARLLKDGTAPASTTATRHRPR
jgi:hypothetical protein